MCNKWNESFRTWRNFKTPLHMHMKTGLSPSPGTERLFQHKPLQPPAVSPLLQPCECQHVSHVWHFFWYVITRFLKGLWHYHITLNSKNKREEEGKKKKVSFSVFRGGSAFVKFIIHLKKGKRVWLAKIFICLRLRYEKQTTTQF